MADSLPTPPPNPDDGPPVPRKLTAETIKNLRTVLLQGNFRLVACNRLGIGWTTFKRWMALGKRYPAGLYGTLRATVLEAEAAAERLAVASVLMAGHNDDAKHLEWWLERKYPERWGRYRGELRQLQKEVEELKKLIGETLAGQTPG